MLVFNVRVGKVMFLELLGQSLGSLFKRKKEIWIANQYFIIMNQCGQKEGMNEKPLRGWVVGLVHKQLHPFQINR